MRFMPQTLSRISMAGLGALVLAATAMAAEVPVGMVTVAQSANIDRAPAALGANVYNGDTLSTTKDGALRLRVGAGQVYMTAMTNAMVSRDSDRLVANILSGTAGISATAADPVEIYTVAGMLRPADNARAFGQVTILAPNRVLVTSFEGTLLLTRGGVSRKIEAGKSYSVTVPASAGAQIPQGYPNGNGQGGSGSGGGSGNGGQTGFDIGVGAGTLLLGYGLYTVFSESQSNP
jgi:hypothetical protein